MVGHHEGLLKQCGKIAFFHPKLHRFFIGEVGVEHHDAQPILLQHLNDQFADHSRADESHRFAVISLAFLMGVPSDSVPLFTVETGGKIVTLIGKKNLRYRHFRHGYGVCRPRGKDLDSAGKEGAGKLLHASRAVKETLKSRQTTRDLLLGHLGHPPRGKDELHICKFLRGFHQRLTGIDLPIQIRQRSDGVYRFGIKHLQKLFGLFTQKYGFHFVSPMILLSDSTSVERLSMRSSGMNSSSSVRGAENALKYPCHSTAASANGSFFSPFQLNT